MPPWSQNTEIITMDRGSYFLLLMPEKARELLPCLDSLFSISTLISSAQAFAASRVPSSLRRKTPNPPPACFGNLTTTLRLDFPFRCALRTSMKSRHQVRFVAASEINARKTSRRGATAKKFGFVVFCFVTRQRICGD